MTPARPFREGLLGVAASDEPFHYVTWVGDLRVIVLDSTVPGAAHGELDRTQLDWLQKELVAPAPEGTIMVLHHPPIPGPVPVINYLVLQNPEALAAVVQGSDVLAVLAGHAHHPISGIFAGVLCFAAPATAYTVDPLAGESCIRGIEGPGFGLVHMYGRTAVASAVLLNADPRELYVHQVGPDIISRLDRTGARGRQRRSAWMIDDDRAATGTCARRYVQPARRRRVSDRPTAGAPAGGRSCARIVCIGSG